MSHQNLSPAALARRIIAHGGPGELPAGSLASAQDACERLFGELRYWVGADGGRVLFRRALAEARSAHPSLQSVQLLPGSESLLGSLHESAEKHGAAATVAGIEAMLVAILQLLGRLIGDDMTLKFAEDSLSDRARTDAGRTVAGRSEKRAAP